MPHACLPREVSSLHSTVYPRSWSGHTHDTQWCCADKTKHLCHCELKLFRRDRLPSPCSLVWLLSCAVEWAARSSFASILRWMFYRQPKALMCGFSWSSLKEFTLFLSMYQKMFQKKHSPVSFYLDVLIFIDQCKSLQNNSLLLWLFYLFPVHFQIGVLSW